MRELYRLQSGSEMFIVLDCFNLLQRFKKAKLLGVMTAGGAWTIRTV